MMHCCYIYKYWNFGLIESLEPFKLYRSLPYLVNCIVEEGGSNSVSGDQSI